MILMGCAQKPSVASDKQNGVEGSGEEVEDDDDTSRDATRPEAVGVSDKQNG